ncbi:hypothetical protein CTDIVETGP_2293 [Clostridium tyrobutyricum DIVETGP]|uniref:Uncharacterized protein n=1 Tax=Clostridium tyrobutyricum DIVETGP TaxID=1408889 RepID=W6N6F0_CLOTY|nr:hypothetical protein [Clostridium tyrobutyricum]AND83788.1 hypothetical protein CTK_C05230 [Clostridium tyrobutyricum]CDL92223.1 hypothetical protein CTDIVETGP_2293 [Clostridium tyrobutyricum DIVETGP]
MLIDLSLKLIMASNRGYLYNEEMDFSNKLIDQLLDRKVSIIGIDCAGIKTYFRIYT